MEVAREDKSAGFALHGMQDEATVTTDPAAIGAEPGPGVEGGPGGHGGEPVGAGGGFRRGGGRRFEGGEKPE